jgi:hypothetical protein
MAYEVITTRYRNGRIRAAWGSDSLRIDFPYNVGGQEEKHASAAVALCRKLGQHGNLRAGYDEKTKGYVFIYEPTSIPATVYPIDEE